MSLIDELAAARRKLEAREAAARAAGKPHSAQPLNAEQKSPVQTATAPSATPRATTTATATPPPRGNASVQSPQQGMAAPQPQPAQPVSDQQKSPVQTSAATKPSVVSIVAEGTTASPPAGSDTSTQSPVPLAAATAPKTEAESASNAQSATGQNAPATPPRTDDVAQPRGHRGRTQALRALLAKPPLLPSEDEALYDELVTAFRAEINPTDIFEEMWLGDIVYNLWEGLRLRGFKVGLVTAAKQEALEKTLQRLMSKDTLGIDISISIGGPSQAEDLAWRCINGDEAAKKEVDELLETAGLDWVAILAQAMALKIDAIERFDSMSKQAEVRRDVVLHLIDKRRTLLGRTPLGKIQEVEDVEYREVELRVEAEKKAA
jgi:hypothetical protein